MGKLLFWILVGAVVYLGYRMLSASRGQGQRTAAHRAQARQAGEPGEPMRRCAHCGIHVPQSDAISEGERHFCSIAHRDEAAER
ncbi:MAG: PP0621 family protein [Quisquiliibacterium sp.]